MLAKISKELGDIKTSMNRLESRFDASTGSSSAQSTSPSVKSAAFTAELPPGDLIKKISLVVKAKIFKNPTEVVEGQNRKRDGSPTLAMGPVNPGLDYISSILSKWIPDGRFVLATYKPLPGVT